MTSTTSTRPAAAPKAKATRPAKAPSLLGQLVDALLPAASASST